MTNTMNLLLIIIFLLPLLEATTVDLHTCPDEQLRYWKRCFPSDIKKIATYMCIGSNSEQKSWSEALSTCRQFGAHLAILDPPTNCPLSIRDITELTTMWVGGHLDGGLLWWEWDVPQPFPGYMSSGYSQTDRYVWEPGHPDLSAGSCVSATHVNNSNTSQHRIKMTDCSTKLPYICMTKSYKREVIHAGSPAIIKDPVDMISIPRPQRLALLRTPMKRQATVVAPSHENILTCEASNYHPDLPVVWVKDGVYIDNGVGGFQFHINDTNIKKTGARSLEGLQGYYSCEVWGVKPDFRRVRSRPALVTFRGVATFRTNITVIASPLLNHLKVPLAVWRYLQRDSLSHRPQQLHLSFYEEAYRHFLAEVFRVASTYQLEYIIDAVSPIPNNTTHILLRISSYYDWYRAVTMSAYSNLPNANVTKGVIAGDQRETVDSLMAGLIYRTLVQHLKSDNLSRAIGKIDFGFQLSRADACQEEQFNISGQLITLPTTWLSWLVMGGAAEEIMSTPSRETCPFERIRLATGYCTGTFRTGGRWVEVMNVNRCTGRDSLALPSSSSVTQGLEELAQQEINSGNVLTVARDFVNLTKKHEKFNVMDLIYASRVLDNIADLAQSPFEVGEWLVEAIDDISKVNEAVMQEAQERNNAASRIVTAMDKFAGNVKLDSTGQLTVRRSNVELQVVDRTPTRPVYGAGLSSSTNGLSLYNQSIDVQQLSSVEAAIILSNEAISIGEHVQRLLRGGGGLHTNQDASVRISFSVHRRSALFPVVPYDGCSKNERIKFNSLESFVLSTTISGIAVSDLDDPIQILFKTKDITKGLQHMCAYWDYNEQSLTWHWSDELIYSNTTTPKGDGHVLCYSKHLTNFAVIAGYKGNDPVLNALSIVGLVFSIIGLTLTIFSHLAFRLWQDRRRSRSQLVLLHLSLSLLAVDLIVIAGLDRTDWRPGCMLVAALLHYFLLVSFIWMLIEGVLQYLKFVKVFDTYSSHFMYKTTIPAWICPGLVVGLVAVIDVQQFRGSDRYCWLAKESFYAAFLLPLALIMITNLVLFILVIKAVTCDRLDVRSTQRKEELVKFQVLLGVCSFIVMGLAWLTAFLAIDTCTHFTTAMHYLFCILNSTQGFLIFLFLNVREKQVRDGWKNLLSRCCFCIEITTVTTPVVKQEVKPVRGKEKSITINQKRITFIAKRLPTRPPKPNENSSDRRNESSSIEVTNSNDTAETSVSSNSGQNYIRMNFGLRRP